MKDHPYFQEVFPNGQQLKPSLPGGSMLAYRLLRLLSEDKRMKRKSSTFFFIVIGLLSTILSVGCGTGRLTRSKAEELVMEQYKFPVPVTDLIGLGKVGVNDHDEKEYESWQKEGVVQVQSKRKYTGEHGMFDFYGATQVLSVQITSAGQKYVLKDKTEEYRKKTKDKENVIVLLCQKEFAEITGIVGGQEQNDNHAVVYFTWRYGSD